MAEFMPRTSASRRLRWLPAVALAVVAGAAAFFLSRGPASPSQETPASAATIPADAPLSAQFALANGRVVVLDYLDSDNFRLTDEASATETLIVGGEIFLHYPERDSRPERLWRYGRLATGQAKPNSPEPVELRPTTLPPQGVALWGDVGKVFDVEVRSSGPLGTPTDATVARLPELANAQWRIATRLTPAMDMSLCGDGVQLLTSWWDPALAGAGWAILATSAGVRLDGAISKLSQIPALPAGLEARPLPLTGDAPL
jgi:hypothetical protein